MLRLCVIMFFSFVEDDARIKINVLHVQAQRSIIELT